MFIVFPRIRTRISILALPTLLVMVWLEGGAAVAILVVSALLHEAGHIAAMRLCGHRVRRIDVLPMGAVIVCPEGIPDKQETIIAVSGPLVSLSCAFSAMLWCLADTNAVSAYAVVINMALGLFNLLPIKKLDGGKALYCFVSEKTKHKKETAERFCSAVSTVTKLWFVAVCAVCIALSGYNLGVILLLLALAVQLLID